MGNGTASERLAKLRQFIDLYQRWGLSIIPVVSKEKKAAVPWQQFQKVAADKTQLNQWYLEHWSNGGNIGIVCGKVSRNLVVLDFDTEDSWANFLRWQEEHRLDNIYKVTPVVKTGRGYQVWLRSKKTVNSRKLDSLDIKGHGGYVVAPPSIHPNGKTYEFINPDIDQILEVNDLSEVGVDLKSFTPLSKPSNWATEALRGVNEGDRDNTCISLAGRYKAKGLAYDEALTLLLDWGKRCNPPFPNKEVEKCVKSAYGYQGREAQKQAQALAQAKEVALKRLRLEDTNIIDVALATVIANKTDGDPMWLLLVGAPSTGRSEILRGLFGCNGIHPLGGFTANTFASGFEKANVGLLETLPKEITLVIKDFGTLLTMRHEDKALVLQQLREIYDGEYKKEYGNGKVVYWKGKMGLLGAVTTAIENYHSVIGELGNRYVLYRCEVDEALRGDIATTALNDEGAEQQMRQEIAGAFEQAVDNAPKAGLVTIPEEIKERLAPLANLISRLRSPVSRNPYDKTVNYQPDIEGPARLVKAFAKLGKGLSAVRGKLSMTDDEYEVIKKVGRDTVPKRRIVIIRYLLDGEWHRTKEISNALSIPQATIGQELEDLMMIEVLTREFDLTEGEEPRQTTPYRWQLKQNIAALITRAGLFQQVNASY